jgi:hypothetical protein
MAGTLDRLDPNGPGSIPASTALGAAMAKSLGTAPSKPVIPENADFREQEPLLPPKLNEQAEPVKTEPVVEKKEEPVKVETPAQVTPDPFEPLKQRLGERPLDEWLSEVDNVHLEKETLNSRVVELEEKAKEQYERLVEYDFRNSDDYVTNVTEPINKAAKHLVFLMGDNESAKLAINIWEETKDNSKERRERLKNLAAEQDISLGDLSRAVDGYMETHAQAEKFTKNWETTRTEKLKAQVLRQEQEAQAFQESQRRSRQAALFHAQAKISELGIPHLDGFDDAKRNWESVISGIENGKAADLNQEVTYAIAGRLLLQNLKSFKADMKELADLREASRSNPNASLPKQDSKPVSNNPLLKL